MNDTQSQPQILAHKRKVLSHLITRGPIDQDLAKSLFGCGRLAARIDELRNDHGFDITTARIKNASGRGWHGRYSINGKGTPEFTDNVKALLGI